MTSPSAAQVTEQVLSLLSCLNQDVDTSKELMIKLGLKHRQTFLYNYLQAALAAGLIEMTIPHKPKSRFQKYKLTNLGKQHRQES